MSSVEIETHLNSLLKGAKAFSEFINESITHPSKQADASLKEVESFLTGCTLRDYQRAGLQWLISVYRSGASCILADEMGLGKTIQAIGLISFVRAQRGGPCLVVCPLSTLGNWQREFKRFAPSIETLRYHGTKPARRELVKAHMDGKEMHDIPVVLTSFEIAMRDASELSRLPWGCIVVDEGHRLKNHDSKLKKILTSYTSHDPMGCCRVLLSGTPLQNDIRELFSLLNFVMPYIFQSIVDFEDTFAFLGCVADSSEATEAVVDAEKQDQIVSKLHSILSTFILRRTKREVHLRLPAKHECVLFASQTAAQKKFMLGALTHGVAATAASMGWTYHGDDSDSAVAQLEKQPFRNKLMQCRKVANHPYLFAEPRRGKGQHHTGNGIVDVCGKMQLLDTMLSALHKKGHKVLIFSQMTRMLDILEDYLRMRTQWGTYCRIDGSTPVDEREEQIDEFNGSKDAFAFLLSTRAGGLGINLVAADTVILYDSDWNPHQDSQAEDRCHRIGQTRPVIVYRLIAHGSVEVQMLRRANRKRALERLVLSNKYVGASRQLAKTKSVVPATASVVASVKRTVADALHDPAKDIDTVAASLHSQSVDHELLQQILDEVAKTDSAAGLDEEELRLWLRADTTIDEAPPGSDTGSVSQAQVKLLMDRSFAVQCGEAAEAELIGAAIKSPAAIRTKRKRAPEPQPEARGEGFEFVVHQAISTSEST